MTTDHSRHPFERVRAFDWDETKRISNLKKHGIDFEDATEIFRGEFLVARSDRKDEERWIALGEMEGRIVAVVFAERKDVRRLISARRANKHEAKWYNQRIRGSPKGQD